MIDVDVPDFGRLQIHHVVLDYNGTMAIDGALVDGVADRLTALSEAVEVHVLTADTFGRVRVALDGLDLSVHVLPPESQAEAKARYVMGLGASSVAAYGNGRNDRLMLERAALGVALVQREGAAAVTVASADVICTDIVSGLELLTEPLRLVATLRS